jgi:hypothetical protein
VCENLSAFKYLLLCRDKQWTCSVSWSWRNVDARRFVAANYRRKELRVKYLQKMVSCMYRIQQSDDIFLLPNSKVICLLINSTVPLFLRLLPPLSETQCSQLFSTKTLHFGRIGFVFFTHLTPSLWTQIFILSLDNKVPKPDTTCIENGRLMTNKTSLDGGV